MYGALDISTSGMIAQRTRLEVVSANLANQSALLDTKGRLNPYKRRIALFAPEGPGGGPGVRVARIVEDQTPQRLGEYNPRSPLAFKDGPFQGYVAETNVNSVVENINAMEAARAYEANVMAAEATKQMVGSALRLLA